MNFLYHRVPKHWQGDILYPLSTLKDILPRVYAKEILKYKERRHITGLHIPPLNCQWNDVLHLTAVHPSKIREALVKAGGRLKEESRYFQIDPHLLETEKTTVYLVAQLRPEDLEHPENFVAFDADDIARYGELPDRAIRYYRECVQKGNKPLIFKFIPHILYQGNLDISQAEIITV